MKFTFSWLKFHLKTTHTVEEIADKLTDLGLEVDGIEDASVALKDFTIAHILSAEKHPDADKLKVCQVDIGKGDPVTIVCGGPNARAGIKVVFAGPGVTIPSNGLVLKLAKIRGVESCGMMCSETELGLGEESNGIMELPEDAPVGGSFVEYMGLNDPVVEISLTPNRGDCLGIRGIARDLAAAGMGTVVPLEELPFKPFKTFGPSPVTVMRDLPKELDAACSHFTGRLIRGVQNKPSPQWMQQLMKAVGLKSISALVDVTNFFSQAYCRPLHVFDADKLSGGKLTVRMAKEGEQIKALDEETYTMTDQMVAIADEAGPVAIGGVMGGLDSGCSMDTTNVFLEAAYFDPIRIARTGRKLNIISDARYRFERGVDPAFTLEGMNLATALILELCGGEASDAVDVGTPLQNRTDMTLAFETIQKHTAVTVSSEEVVRILGTLGCEILSQDKSSVSVRTPSWRHDLANDLDLVEEVLRVHGYHHIPLLDMPACEKEAPLTLPQQRVSTVRHVLAERGMKESVTWSMIDAKTAKLFGGGQDDLRIVNPISMDLEWMRPSSLPHLIAAVKRNMSRGLKPVNLFEVGPAYRGSNPEDQETVAAGVRCGKINESHWSGDTRAYDAFDAKNDALAVLERAGINTQKVQVKTEGVPGWFHPYRSGLICQGPKNVLAVFGEVHPAILKKLVVKTPVMGFEVYLSKLPTPKQAKANKGRLELSAFQAVERDLAFILDADIPASKLMAVAEKAGKPLLTDITVFDVYEGDNVEAGKKSLAIRFQFQSMEHTLTDEDINATFNAMIAAIEKETGGQLRDGK